MYWTTVKICNLICVVIVHDAKVKDASKIPYTSTLGCWHYKYITVKSSMQSLGCIPSWTTMKISSLINLRCMCEGYGSYSVCLSVNKLAATYLVCKSKLRYYTIPYGVPNACLYGFRWKYFFRLFCRHLLMISFLTFRKWHSTFYLYERSCIGAVYGMLGAWARFSESPAHWMKYVSWGRSL